MIPEFPHFTAITLDDRELVNRVIAAQPPLASEYTFTNLFAWRQANRYALARYGDGLLVRKESPGAMSFLQPLGMERPLDAVMDCLAYLEEAAHVPVIERVDDAFLRALPSQSLTVVEERDQFDYLYSVEELIALPGDRFHDKKNLLAQFHKKHQYRYLPLCEDHLPHCLAFAHEWCVERRCEESDGLTRENCAVIEMLTHYRELHLTGGALEVDGELAAFTLGERLNPDTLVVHAEKAKVGIVGAYQAINQEFLRHAGAEYRYVNREQDLGVPGLRKAKLSYNPIALVKKYRINRA